MVRHSGKEISRTMIAPHRMCLPSMVLCLIVCLLLAGVAYSQDGRPGSHHNPSDAKERIKDRDETARRLTRDELEVLLKKIEEECGKIQSLVTDFVQEKHISIFAAPVEARGVCVFQSPGAIRFEFLEPFKSVLIVKDGTVIKYEFMEGGWKRLETGDQQLVLMIIDHITSWLKGRFREKDEIYEISAEKRDATSVILTPRAEGFRKHIASIELGMREDRWGIKYIVIREHGEDYTQITFTRERQNIKIPEHIFNTSGLEPMPIGQLMEAGGV
jgi:hypothetical protein